MSAPEVGLVPPEVVTVTSTIPPECAGAVAVMCPESITVKVPAAAAPKLTVLAPVKPAPWMSTVLPPAVGPPFGTTEVTTGTQLHEPDAVLGPFDVVAVMSTGPPEPAGLTACR